MQAGPDLLLPLLTILTTCPALTPFLAIGTLFFGVSL